MRILLVKLLADALYLQTDAALLAFAASRRLKGLPGLKTLSIISSPDLTDASLVTYLSTILSDVEDSSDIDSFIHEGRHTLGDSLISLTLVNCPLITVQSLSALERRCENLQQLDLRNVDGFFGAPTQQDVNNSEEICTSKEIFHRFITNNTAIHTFTFSSGLPTLPTDLFSPFDTPGNALQNLNIYSSKAIRPHHLYSFPSIYRLTVSGCTNLRDDLPFEYMPRLQELSFLGRGLSLFSLWKLFMNESIRKITLDVAGSAYESCICSDSSKSEESDIEGAHASSSANERKVHKTFPALLETFKKHNILSSTIPSWVVAFFIASSPNTLESISLHGSIVPTCCSTRTSPPPSSLSFQSQVAGHSNNAYPFTYRNFLRPAFNGIPLLWSITNSIPAFIARTVSRMPARLGPYVTNQDTSKDGMSRALEYSAATALARLSLRTLQGLIGGPSAACHLPDLVSLKPEIKLEGCPNVPRERDVLESEPESEVELTESSDTDDGTSRPS